MGLFKHPGGGHKKIEGLAHMVEGGHHLRKSPNTHPLWLNKVSANERRRNHDLSQWEKGHHGTFSIYS